MRVSEPGPCPDCGKGQLDVIEPLRFGALVRCHRCELVLYLDGRGTGEDVSADDVRMLREWNAAPQRLPTDAMRAIAAIGFDVIRDLRGVAAVRAPCRVVLEEEAIEPVLVLFEASAPVGRSAVIPASRVLRIEATRLALAPAVRDAARSDAPMLFRTARSGFVRLRKGSVFVQEAGIDGGDVAVCWRDEIGNDVYERELERAPTVGHAEARTVAVDLDEEALAFFAR